MKEKSFEQAAKFHSDGLEIQIAAHGEKSIFTAYPLRDVGHVLTKLGRLDEAEEKLMKAHAIWENIATRMKDDDQAIFLLAMTQSYIGALREAQGRREEAIKLRKRGGRMVCSYDRVCFYSFLSFIFENLFCN